MGPWKMEVNMWRPVAILLLGVATYAHASASVGTLQFLTPGIRHRIDYSVDQALDDSQIIDLGNITGVGAYNTTCNLDQSAIVVAFSEEDYAQAFMNYVFEVVKMAGDDLFLTASGPYGCPVAPTSSQNLLLRRLITDPMVLDGTGGKAIKLRTAQANYDEVYSSANISYTSAPDEGGWNMCIGVNADPTTCAQAAGPLMIYSSGVVDVSCDNCFAGFHANVFFDISIHGFLLRHLAGGFRNMSVDAAIGLDATANVDKPILSVEKQLLHAGGADYPVLSFRIGAIPFALWFESNVGFHGDLTFGLQAQASVGVDMQYGIGDSYIQWAEGSGWSHVRPSPSLHFTPQLSAHADFRVEANVGLTTQVAMHVNGIFTHSLSLNPSMNMVVQGDTTSKQICVNSGYEAALVSQGALHLSILWHLVHVDATFGPETLWSANGSLPEKCTAPAAPASSTLMGLGTVLV